jgi:16S rRNA (uracil1498-N3)-methyltransferase
MQLFYTDKVIDRQAFFDNVEAAHLFSSLRKKEGDTICFTDGKGQRMNGHLIQVSRKEAIATIESIEVMSELSPVFHLVIAPTKQMDRMEWLVEKCTEMGISKISFLLSKRCERPRINIERIKKLTISAIKQSLQYHLPQLEVLEKVNETTLTSCKLTENFIATCVESSEYTFSNQLTKGKDVCMLIGPEGDFTTDEINIASSLGFQKISLGSQRLRTETAGIYANAVFKSVNNL